MWAQLRWMQSHVGAVKLNEVLWVQFPGRFLNRYNSVSTSLSVIHF